MDIQFCNGTAKIINEYDDKNKILNFLFRKVCLKNYRFCVFNKRHLNFLKNNEHYFILNNSDTVYWNYLHSEENNKKFSGRCFFILMRLDGVYRNFLIDRKTLKYNLSNVNISNVMIVEVNFIFSPNLYDSILDCNLIRGNQRWVCRINDIHLLSGFKQTTDIKTKLKNIDTYLNDEKYFEKSDKDVCKIDVVKLFEYNDLLKIKNYIPSGSSFFNDPNTNFNYNGFFFIPKNPKKTSWILYLIRNNIKKNSVKKNTKEECVKFVSSKILTFEMRKTEFMHIYKLYICDDIKNIKLIGYAHIGSVKRCKEIKSLFVNGIMSLLMDCKYNNIIKKWEPLNVSNKSSISCVND